ncbi:MAG: ABC transporter [Alphaproteobacteria bacterium]|nr:ABC transporter [Alphaproteobacteria bacterium]
MPSLAQQRKYFSVAGLMAIAVLFVAAVALTNTLLRGQRIDLTQDRLFTLSDGSRAILGQIQEPITLRFYFSSRLGRDIPAIGTYGQRVRDLLEEYASHSKGKLRLEALDPQPYTEQEDRAVAFGLQGVPIDQGGELVYFGLAGSNSTDDRQIIAFFDQAREQFLEYDITRIVYNLVRPEKRRVGLITTLPLAGTPYARMAGGGDDSWIIHGQLQEFFAVEMLSRDVAEISDKIDVLILVHPKGLTDRALYAIDQYLLKGGRLLVFVDPHSEIDAQTPKPGGPTPPGDANSNLEKLFQAWGIEVPRDVVVGDQSIARRVQAPTETQGQTRVAAIDYPAWLAITADYLNRKDPVTAELNYLNIASPGSIEVKEGSSVTLTPLIQTSAKAGPIPVASVQMRPDPLKIARDFKPGDQVKVIAARLSGQVKSAFPDGPPKSEEPPADGDKKDLPKPGLTESVQSINVIVVADVDMLADGLWVRVQDFFGQRMAVPMANNGGFFVNAVDSLAGSNELISLRSRGVIQRPFLILQTLQREAERRFRAKEQELNTRLSETEKRLTELQGDQKSATAGALLTAELRQEIENFRTQAVDIRRSLRDVQRALREDVEWLTGTIKAINITAIPIVVIVVSVVLSIMRRNRRRRPQTA